MSSVQRVDVCGLTGLSGFLYDVGMTDLTPQLNAIVSGEVLSAGQAEDAFDLIMSGQMSDIQVAALLTGLQVRGVAASELAGGVRALRKAMIPVQVSADGPLVDTCGTGGGKVTTFNISTAAAIVAAGAGTPIAKHGNRSFTSRSGSADVLEALGVDIELTPDEMSSQFTRAGIVFMFAPLLHPAMRHVGPVRRSLGIRTIMNLLGPLTNPAGATRQVVGVADPELVPLISGALLELGHSRAMVVHGEPGMDELSPLGHSHVVELRNGKLSKYIVDPQSLKLPSSSPGELGGGEPHENAALVEKVLKGEERGGARSAVVLNAGAAIYLGDLSEDLEAGVRLAEQSIDTGQALAALNRLRNR